MAPASDISRALKIVFTGTPGAGKTTAIRAIGDRSAPSPDGPVNDGVMEAKRLAAVGFDYGECQLDAGTTLRLFGTPGQERFQFMWNILASGALGLVVLVDDTRPDPIGDVAHYLQAFAPQVPARRTVVGVGRIGERASQRLAEYCDRLDALGFHVPVLEVDVREPTDVRLLLSVLVSMAEVEHA